MALPQGPGETVCGLGARQAQSSISTTLGHSERSDCDADKATKLFYSARNVHATQGGDPSGRGRWTDHEAVYAMSLSVAWVCHKSPMDVRVKFWVNPSSSFLIHARSLIESAWPETGIVSIWAGNILLPLPSENLCKGRVDLTSFRQTSPPKNTNRSRRESV
jgi:hypothetical protein